MLLRALRPLRSIRAILLLAAAWLSLLSARPLASADSDRELTTSSSVDVSIATPIARYLIVSSELASTRVSRVTPLALFVCAAALLLLALQTVERTRIAARDPVLVLDPRVAPYDATAPPVLRLSLSARS
ncbi:MAG TPA: hypothetical protein VGM82_10490 [Gemmatimonadaceae bacterium]|jgi:hypothetical protein